MKVLAICGSPRNGNTEFMLKTILSECQDSELILLKDLDIKHCDGCDKCCKTGNCHIQDDMQKIYPKLYDADVIIFGSPNYFDNISGMLKVFIDRSNPVGVDRRLKNKKMTAVVSGCKNLDESAKHAVNAIKNYAKIQQMEFLDFIYNNESKAEKNQEIIEKCKQLGKKINS
jgi:multimeric flavodoxin WrbA